MIGYKGGGWNGDAVRYGGVYTPSVPFECFEYVGECIGGWFDLAVEVVSVENLLSSPETACDTVVGIDHDADNEDGGVLFPELVVV